LHVVLIRTFGRGSDRADLTIAFSEEAPMWDLVKARVARKVAMKMLKPFAARCGHLPEGSALAPHVLGFLSKLVTLIAVRQSGDMQTHALASVQSSVIMELTGAGQQIIGEEIHFLSSINDPDFTAGCQSALLFFNQFTSMGSEIETSQPDREEAQNALDVLWREHVATQMARSDRTSPQIS
jgi:hypothetical protein